MPDDSQMIEAYINKEKSNDFYKEAFEKYTIIGVDQFAWHWSWWAMFGGIFYLLYRKLYLEALIYFILFSSLFMIPIAHLILWVASGGIFPYLVYKRYKKMREKIEKNISDKESQLHALRTVGGVNPWAIWLGVFLHVIIWTSILYKLFIISISQGGI